LSHFLENGRARTGFPLSAPPPKNIFSCRNNLICFADLFFVFISTSNANQCHHSAHNQFLERKIKSTKRLVRSDFQKNNIAYLSLCQRRLKGAFEAPTALVSEVCWGKSVWMKKNNIAYKTD
jgi:hypothetical protein